MQEWSPHVYVGIEAPPNVTAYQPCFLVMPTPMLVQLDLIVLAPINHRKQMKVDRTFING